MSAIETIRHVRHIKYDQMVVLVGNKADNSTIAADDDDFDSDEDEDNIVVAPPPPTGLRRLSMIGSRRGSVTTRQQVQPAPRENNSDSNSEDDDDDHDQQPVLREIAKREAALEALRLGALFFETSAKTGHNIYILFNEISKILVHKRRKLLFKIEAGIKNMQDENDEHSSDFESDNSDSDSDNDDMSDNENVEEGKSFALDEEGQALKKQIEKQKKQKKKEEESSSDDDDSVLSAMSDWSDEDDDSDDDYVDVYGWGGKKKTEKADCTIM
jgi:hypothetical protein